MSTVRDVLTAHAGRYPLMCPQDGVKLLYQNEFGPGHLIADPAQASRRLAEEYARTPRRPELPLFEDIGCGFLRVMLPALEEELLEETGTAFLRSAALRAGSGERFAQKLAQLRALTAEGAFAFTSAELEEYLAAYTAAGCPPVSHSGAYREAYSPAYRVVHSRFLGEELRALLIAQRLEQLRRQRGRVVAAIDGRCASGKTTLARRLQGLTGCAVVHMDHFFLRPEQRTPQRYAQSGGNVDRERFLEEVLLPLSRGERLRYRPFDCHAMALAQPVDLGTPELVVVEGSYSCHPALAEHYDLKIFLSADEQTRLGRIALRDGADYVQVFREKWIPLEERYFAAFPVEADSDLSFA